MSSLHWATRSLALAVAAALYGPAAAGAQETIAFQSDRDGHDGELWLVGSNGGNERPLTQNATPDATPSWSPDGTTIVYACAPAGNWELCKIDVATRVVTQLTHTFADEFDPRYTPDGMQIVLESYPNGRNADIAMMPAAGGVPAPLMSTPGDDDQDPTPDPNSTRIAFATDGDVSILDTDVPGEVRPVTNGAHGDTDPFFSTQDEIAFSRRTGKTHDVLVASPDGALKRQLTRGGPEDLEPAWTADATQVFFTRSPSGGRGFRIFAMGAGGQGQRPVTKGGAYDDTEPAVQPPGGAGLMRSPLGLVLHASAVCHQINGSSAAETLYGTNQRDCVYAKGGKDTVKARKGNDSLYVTDSLQDTVDGGPGADEAWIDDGLDIHVSTAVH